MKLLFLSCLLLAGPLARAQSDAPYTSEYLFLGVAPAASQNNSNTASGFLPPSTPILTSTPPTNNWYTAGLGLERFFGKHVGGGVDLSALVPGQGKIVSSTIGTFSPNAYFHWSFASQLDLHAVGGYSLLFRDFTANYYTIGGGLTYWMGINGSRGLMFQYRRLNPIDVGPSYNEIRFGIAFRQK